MADVESLTSSLVREYLSRKSLKDTLSMLDKEMPRTSNCINNRAQLGKELHINGLMKKNKESAKNFRTMLEVVVKFMVDKAWVKLSSVGEQGHSVGQSSKIISSRQQEHGFENLDSSSKENTAMNKGLWHLQTEKPDSSTRITSSELYDHLSVSASDGHKKTKEVRAPSSEERVSGSEDRSGSLSNNKKKDDLFNEWELVDNDKTSSRSRLRGNVQSGFSEEFVTDNFGKKSHQQSISNKEKSVTQNMRTDQSHNKTVQSSGDLSFLKNPLNFGAVSSQRKKRNISGSILSTGLKNTRNNEKTNYVKESLTEDFDKQYEAKMIAQNAATSKDDIIGNPSNIQVPIIPKKEKINEKADWKKEIIQNKEQRKHPTIKNESYDELIFEDIDDNFDEELQNLHLDISRKPVISSTQSRPITLQNARDLKSILFGSSFGIFNQEWRNQGFSFCEHDYLKYGIVQHKGGPCGLLASVQAVVLKHLLFADNSIHSATKQLLKCSSEETNSALCSALSEIIWRAGENKRAEVTLRSEKAQFVASASYKPDKLTEKLLIYELCDYSELELFLKENINQFSSDGESGSILLLYSVIFSRTIEKIREDMDDPRGTLMGAHGYCTQDMVNLLLTGKAVSNTFNDVIELDAGGKTKNILKGLDKQSDIGLLSLFEYYKSCMVGSHFKNPRYPIWVVCSESHFSVLFSLKRNLLNERRSQKRFDLYYYDGLARQDEEIRLSVDTTAETTDEDVITEDLTPPLELCIKTKWKDAVVDWNGTEPLL